MSESEKISARKPSLALAMSNLIAEVKQQFPLEDPETFVCGPKGDCVGCPKKLIELVDSELMYWEHSISRGIAPNFEEIRRFGKLCTNVRRGLKRNGLVD
ncbi:hypothetical protein L4C33_00935 [Vibrio makurazakiensis]|uniref:hypothetical protein n=1 Tax=Vibrio makurazakiensis TaxID=2910250 RepID=UPI003D0A20D5